MRKILSLTLVPALPALLAAAVLTGCGGGGDPGAESRTADRAAGERTTTTAAPAAPDSEAVDVPASSTAAAPADASSETATEPTTTAPPTTAAPTTTAPPAPPADGRRYTCPEGGIDAVRALQQAVDQGHQPWRLSAEDVAAACTFGVGASTVEPAGPNRYEVTETSTGDRLLVTVAQPLGPNTIWAVTSTTPA
jgi:hypothetical protein